MTLTASQRTLKRQVKEDLQAHKLDDLVRKSESELITITETIGIENVDTLSKKELIIKIMKHGFSCMPVDLCTHDEGSESGGSGGSEPAPEPTVTCSELEEDQCNGEENCTWEDNACVEIGSEAMCGEYTNEEECNSDPLSLCSWEGTGDDAACVEIVSTTEPFGNLFNMNQFYRERNTMILIIVVILFFMYKDEIMKSNVVKSLKKMLK